MSMHFSRTNIYGNYDDHNAIHIRIKIMSKSKREILSDQYKLYKPRTIIKLKIKIDEKYINYLCRMHGYVNILEFLKNSELLLPEYCTDAISLASCFRNIDVLEWWKRSGLPLKYDSEILDRASKHGCTDILDWWKNSGLPLNYDHNMMDIYCDRTALNWWKKSGLPLKYSENALLHATQYGRIDILDWWKNSGLPLKYSKSQIRMELTVIYTYSYYHEIVLEWWEKSGLLKL